VGLVCRGKAKKTALRVERRLVGVESVEFKTEDLDPGEERCALFSDLVRAGTLTDGGFRYEIHVVGDGGEEVASGVQEFLVLGEHAQIPPAGP
jgi:hypothetical protein